MPPEFQRLFPRMPGEVFHIWLGPLLDYYQLDPLKIAELYRDKSWCPRLGGRTFHDWAEYDWTRTSCPLDRKLLHPLTIERATAIETHATTRTLTSTSDIISTNKRFWLAAAHVRQNPSGYTPLVTISLEGKLYVIDGHHRLAAILAQPLLKNPTLELWLGSPAL